MLWVDQYGERIYARSIKELREKAGGGHVSKMYVDQKNGPPVCLGRVVGRRWFTAFVPYQVPA